MTTPNGHHTQSIGTIREVDIINEMQAAYLDYAMSVIVARALPDVRDGLKPVHRRILYAMHHDLSLDSSKSYKKSARIVGEVLGKYHPHGDVAVYDAMVRLAQEFSLRYPLIDGQGNFGSIDGDNAAAMRYTEARMAAITDLMITDLEKDTVDWHDNFDSTLQEPDILPASLPNLLINGASGIAVGMATNIPPHNLGEIVDALIYLIDRFDQLEGVTVEDLMRFVKGPDFPTGGILYRFRPGRRVDEEDTDAITQGYATGRARLTLQAKAHFEEMSRSRSRIVVTELPYQTNKTNLIERIASLVRDSKIEGITDLRDESDRTGMRLVIELTRNVDPKDILADLFKYTPMQQTFGVSMLALVDGEPKTLSLKRMLHLFIEHRREIVRRRSEYDLERARARAHIVEGLLRALDILDEVIQTIRHSQRVETARTNLMRNFGFSELQAQAILDMPLKRLAALERRRLQDEYKELQDQIAYLEGLLADPAKMLKVIKDELLAIRATYNDARRTQIVERTGGTLTTTDLLPDQQVWVTIGSNGEVRRQPVVHIDGDSLQRVAKGSEATLTIANTRDFLYLFAVNGQCRRLAVHELPPNGESKHFAELTEYTRRDTVLAALAFPRTAPQESEGHLFLVTEQGSVKRVILADFLSAAVSDPEVMRVEEKDRLGWVLPTNGEQEVILFTAKGKSIRFSEADVRSMGLSAGGIGGIKVAKGDLVVAAAVVEPDGEVLSVTRTGFAKRTPLAEYSRQGRNGSGIVSHKINSRTGPVADAAVIGPDWVGHSAALLTAKGVSKSVELEKIPLSGRGTLGKGVVSLANGDAVVALAALNWRPAAKEPDDEPDPEPGDGASPSSQNGTQAGAKAQAKSSSATKKVTGTASARSAGDEKPTAQPTPESSPDATAKARTRPSTATTKSATTKSATTRAGSGAEKAQATGPETPAAQPAPEPETKSRTRRSASTPAKATPTPLKPRAETTAQADTAAVAKDPRVEEGASGQSRLENSSPKADPEIAEEVAQASLFEDDASIGSAPPRQKAGAPRKRKVQAVASVTKSQAKKAKSQSAE